MLMNPGKDEFQEDSATEYEKTVHTLNMYFVVKLNEPYERRVPKNDSTGWRDG